MELMENPGYARRPETYLKLWSLYYKTLDHSRACDISEKAFIKASDIDETHYRIALVIIYAKSLFHVGKFKNLL